MKLTLISQYKVNMGNYESHEFGAIVSLDITDLFDEDELADLSFDQRKAELQKAVREWVEEEITPAMERDAEMSQAEKSILPYPKTQEEPEPPRRTEKLRRSNR